MRSNPIFLALLALVATSAQAGEPTSDLSYTHVDVGYVTVDSGGGSVDGLAAELNYGFSPAFYGLIGLSDIEDSTTLSLGGGWHTRVGANTDLFAEGRFLSTDAGGGTDQGLAIGAGLRGMLSSRFELNGRVDMVDYGDTSDADTQLTVGAVYYFARVGAFAEFTSNDAADALMIGARFRF